MDTGFIVIHRKFLDWEWYDDINAKVLFIHLLFTVNWKDKKWHGMTVKRGSIVTSYNHLSEGTQLSIRQVRTALNKLILTGEVTKQSTSQYTIVTINNYNKYQDKTDKETNERQTNDRRVTTTKQRNKENNNISKDIGKPTQGTLELSLKKQEYGNTDINECTKYLQEKLGASLDGSVKENRQYCYNLLRKMKKDFPSVSEVDNVKMLIDTAMQDKFHSKNATSFKYLYYNVQRIAQSFKADYGIGDKSDIQVI